MINFLQGFAVNIPNETYFLLEIGIVLIVATFLALLVRIFKQPLIPAYILTGILIGPVFLGLIKNESFIRSLSEIGVAFLIFTSGVEIKFKKLKEVGKTVFIGGFIQVIILFIIAYLVSLSLGYSNQSPIYIGLVVAFSSTMIVVKILADKREINSLHGRIIIGILLVQDIAAIIALTILSSDLSIMNILLVLVKAGIFAASALLLSKIFNPIFKNAAKNHDLLLLVSISFLFLFVIGSFAAGFSLIIGAFFAGVSLANSEYKTEIQGKVGPLREFFAVIFFVSLGMQLRMISKDFLLLFFVLLFLVLIIKPIVTMFIVRFLGYKKRTSFLTGNALAQTSEFSFIIVTIGFSAGYISEGLFSTLILLTILSMSITIYLIRYEKKLTKYFDWPLNIFNKYHTKNEELEYHGEDGKKIILIGCHRMGSLFLKEFKDRKKDLFIVDFNPDIIKPLMMKKVPCIYGDFINDEVFNKLEIKKAEVIISTIPDYDDNLFFIRRARRLNQKTIIFVVSERISEALSLYRAGADYVILPQILGGQRITEIIHETKDNKSSIQRLKKEHIRYLDSIHNILY
ncbi:MAG: cation:proton antiporter [Nanoarchaeota archaeon]|nr:cation:proton antiporter [Nanoarchaeota archaeon]